MEIDLKDVTMYLADGTAALAPENTGVTEGISAEGQDEIEFVTGGVAAAGIELGSWVAVGTTMRPRYFVVDIGTGAGADTITLHKNLEAAIPDETRLYVSDPKKLEFEIGEGNFTYSEKREREIKLSRGRLARVKDADEQPMDVNFDLVWETLTAHSGGNDVIPTDALKRKRSAADWVSTGGECQPFAVDVILDKRPDCATLTKPNEMLIFTEFRYNSIDGDLSSAQLSVPGTSFALEPISIAYADPD